MSCACTHHAAARADLSGDPVTLTDPPIMLHGRLICTDAAQMMMALDLLPDHVALSRAEPGCLRFDIRQDDDPLIWHLDEAFTDAAAFAAHQARTADSLWGRGSRAIGRDLHRHAAQVLIRPETPADHDGLDRLLTRAFAGPAEAALLRDLRASGDLSHSLVAHVNGCPVGHVALSPLGADRPAFALAPLAVHPGLHRRGLGRALIAAALSAAAAPVVVLGDPAVYGPQGFVPATLDTPYAGHGLQIHGHLPYGSRITHAPAFARL